MIAARIRRSRAGQHSARPVTAFTLVELMIGATLSVFLIAGVLSTFLFIVRSETSVQSYNEMEIQSRRALEYFAEDTRQADGLTVTSTSAVTLTINGLAIAYSYDGTAKTLIRDDGSGPAILAQGISTFGFKAYDVTGAELPLVSPDDLQAATQATKQLQITLSLARSRTTVVTATNTVLSARFILRNKKVTT